MNPCAYSALREAAVRLLRLRLSMQTVIPVALPAESYPATRKNGTTGQREIQRDKNGKPLPAYVGKNPSFWKANGTPTQTSHRKAVDEAELLARIDVAERLGKPIGLAVIPSTDVVVIDFDRKSYPSQEACDREWLGLLDLYPELTQTRIERTPGGGVHIYVRPADGMASWRSAAGKLHCQFTPVPGGEHRGEVLAGTRVCVCAPTRSGAGAYELINPDHAYSVVEVPDLASIGIYTKVNATPEPTVPPSSRPASERRAPTGVNNRSRLPLRCDLPVSFCWIVDLHGAEPLEGFQGVAVETGSREAPCEKGKPVECFGRGWIQKRPMRFDGDPLPMVSREPLMGSARSFTPLRQIPPMLQHSVATPCRLKLKFLQQKVMGPAEVTTEITDAGTARHTPEVSIEAYQG
jgi:hypothetical protein